MTGSVGHIGLGVGQRQGVLFNIASLFAGRTAVYAAPPGLSVFTDSGKETAAELDDVAYVWADQAGGSLDFVQAIEAQRPIFKEYYLDFDGTRDMLATGGVGGLICFGVVSFRLSGSGSLRTLLSTRSASTNGFQLRLRTNNQIEVVAGTGIDPSTIVQVIWPTVLTAVDNVAAFWYDGTNVYLSVNGETAVSGAATVLAASANLQLGAFSSAAKFTGRIYGAMFISQESSENFLTQSEMNNAIAYFRRRFDPVSPLFPLSVFAGRDGTFLQTGTQWAGGIGDDVSAWTSQATPQRNATAATPAVLRDNYLEFTGNEAYTVANAFAAPSCLILASIRVSTDTVARELISAYNGDISLSLTADHEARLTIGETTIDSAALTPGTDYVIVAWMTGSTANLQIDSGSPTSDTVTLPTGASDATIGDGFIGRMYGAAVVSEVDGLTLAAGNRAAFIAWWVERKNALEVPVGFNWTPPFQVYADGTTSFSFDPPTEGTARYVAIDGDDDLNNGQSALAPYATFAKAYADNPDTIYVEAGDYLGSQHMMIEAAVPNRSIAFVATGGRARMISGERPTWSLSSGAVYSATVAASAYLVVDESATSDENAETVYEEGASAALSAGQFWLDGTTMYVRCFDDREPDADILVMTAEGTMNAIGHHQNYYFRDFDFWGHERPLVMEPTPERTDGQLVCDNSSMKYGSTGDGLYALRFGFAALRDTVINHNYKDGANYTGVAGALRVLEVDCEMHYNGFRNTDAMNINNGSTLHQASDGVRIGGRYTHNQGGNVTDTGAGTQSWNINCYAAASEASNTLGKSDFRAGGGAEMWLHNCTSGEGSNFSIVTGGNVVKVRGGTFAEATNGETEAF